MHAPRVAAALRGLFAFDGVEFLEDFHRDRQVVILKFQDALGIVEEDVCIEDKRLHLGRDLEPRDRGFRPTHVFHR